MITDQILLGQNTYKIDAKGRLFVPAWSGRETGETLVFIYDEYLDNYNLYSKKYVCDEMERLSSLISKSETDAEKNKAKVEFYKYCKSILRECKVDTQGRITIEGIFEPNEEILVLGAKDYLILESNAKKRKVNK